MASYNIRTLMDADCTSGFPFFHYYFLPCLTASFPAVAYKTKYRPSCVQRSIIHAYFVSGHWGLYECILLSFTRAAVLVCPSNSLQLRARFQFTTTYDCETIYRPHVYKRIHNYRLRTHISASAPVHYSCTFSSS